MDLHKVEEGHLVSPSDFNQYFKALTGDVLPRKSSGMVSTLENSSTPPNLGSKYSPFNEVFCKKINVTDDFSSSSPSSGNKFSRKNEDYLEHDYFNYSFQGLELKIILDNYNLFDLTNNLTKSSFTPMSSSEFGKNYFEILDTDIPSASTSDYGYGCNIGETRPIKVKPKDAIENSLYPNPIGIYEKDELKEILLGVFYNKGKDVLLSVKRAYYTFKGDHLRYNMLRKTFSSGTILRPLKTAWVFVLENGEIDLSYKYPNQLNNISSRNYEYHFKDDSLYKISDEGIEEEVDAVFLGEVILDNKGIVGHRYLDHDFKKLDINETLYLSRVLNQIKKGFHHFYIDEKYNLSREDLTPSINVHPYKKMHYFKSVYKDKENLIFSDNSATQCLLKYKHNIPQERFQNKVDFEDLKIQKISNLTGYRLYRKEETDFYSGSLPLFFNETSHSSQTNEFLGIESSRSIDQIIIMPGLYSVSGHVLTTNFGKSKIDIQFYELDSEKPINIIEGMTSNPGSDHCLINVQIYVPNIAKIILTLSFMETTLNAYLGISDLSWESSNILFQRLR